MECKYCQQEIDENANDKAFTNVYDEDGTGGNDGCSECSGSCDECGERFYMDSALKHAGDGKMLCKNCWENKFDWYSC